MSRNSTRRRGRARLLGTAALAALVFSLGSLASPAWAQPELEVLGTWGGAVNAVFIDEAVNPYIAYVGSGRRLVILDVADSANIIELGSIDLGNLVMDLKVRDGYAFVCTYSAPNLFCVVNVSDLTNPELVWHLIYNAYHAKEVDLYGDVAYVRDGPHFDAFDISNPQAPQFLGRVIDGPPYVWSVAVAGGLMYVCVENPRELRIYGPSADPVNPTLVGSTGWQSPPGCGRPWHLDIAEDCAYLVTDSCFGVYTLTAFDISDPEAPFQNGCYTSSLTLGYVTHSSNGLVYVGINGALEVLDMSVDPNNPTSVATFDTHGRVGEIDIVGTRAYVADLGEGLIVLDISEVGRRGDPIRLGNWHSPASLRRLDKVGDLLYVTDRHNGITILDVSEPGSPEVVGVYQTSEASGQWGDNFGIEVRDGLAYLSAGYGGLEVVDVSDPAQPFLAGAYSGWPADYRSIAIELDTMHPEIAHVGVRPGGGGYMVNFDISDPANIVDVGFVGLGSRPLTIDTTPEGISHIAAGSPFGYGGAVYGVDTSDPNNPFLVSEVTWGSDNAPKDLAVRGNLRYVTNWKADGTGGLYIQDVQHINDPNEPAVVDVGFYEVWNAYGLAVRNDVAYVAAQPEGSQRSLLAVDVSDPGAPLLMGYVQTPGAGADVLVDGRYAYTVGGDNTTGGDNVAVGLAIIDLGLPVGDLNYDGCVDLSDLAGLLANYGTTSGMTYEDGDLDGDEDVDLADLAELLAHYGQGCA